MKSVNFVFAVHNHQPIGNFESVFEEAYQRSYRPFLEVVSQYPSVKCTQHWTGPLLEWLSSRHPEFIRKMRGMVASGQLELLTGAYYEAILAVIPEADRIGQIRKLTQTVRGIFGYDPEGMWLAERVWEQPVAASLAAAGVRFVTVDDTHFRHAGLGDEQLRGYYVTEEQGSPLAVMPIDKTLRYTVPFRNLGETFRYLDGVASEDGQRVVIHADDGEKFGIWPKTYKHVYEDGWLEEFCRTLQAESAWVHTVHFRDVLRKVDPLGRIYLPAASYFEMMKWSLDAQAFIRMERFENDLKSRHEFDAYAGFVAGGFWRNFLAKYPESNHMHKKMLRISQRSAAASSRAPVPQEILDHLWAGQCNDAYWHGVFGGLYLPNLRYQVYHNLLKAESGLDALEPSRRITIERTDFDADGHEEVLLESNPLNMYFTPASGGSMVELDFKPASLNLLDIVSRREEGYHRRLRERDAFRHKETIHEGVLAKESGLERYLHVDWYRRGSLIDHFFGPGTTLEAVARCKYHELGDFVNQPYDASVHLKDDAGEIVLEREGALWSGSTRHRVKLKKTVRYAAGDDFYEAAYAVSNPDDSPVRIHFGIEWNVGLMAGDAHDRYYDFESRALADRRLRSEGEEREVRTIRLVDEWLNVETSIELGRPATVWRFPVETVSLSEGGFERLYQSSVILPHWEFGLAPGEVWQVSVRQVVRRPSGNRG